MNITQYSHLTSLDNDDELLISLLEDIGGELTLGKESFDYVDGFLTIDNLGHYKLKSEINTCNSNIEKVKVSLDSNHNLLTTIKHTPWD